VLERLHGDVIPSRDLKQGFEFRGERVHLIGVQGIFKPAIMALPLSISTAPDGPYDDEVGPDGFLSYRYRGNDPRHRDNVGLRECGIEGLPLVYFHGVAQGRYLADWPVYVQHDDPGSLTFTVACDDPQILRPGLPDEVADDARRRYRTQLATRRVHQEAFRQRVLRAYERRCAVCRLRHEELLDAAHIIPDRDPRGEPVVSNGLSLCKIHHSAFDANIVGIRPDLVVEVREDVLEEHDGPMLQYGIQALHREDLLVPRREVDKPSPVFLEERYEEFRRAG